MQPQHLGLGMWKDRRLPIPDCGAFVVLAELAASLKDGDVVPMQRHEQQEYLVRLGSLSHKLRHRAYQHSLTRMKQARQSIQDSLSQLQQAIDLV